MNWKEDLKKQLAIHESLRLKPYRCSAGKLTIGYGRNLEDAGITADEAGILLDNDIESTLRDLHRALPWWTDLVAARRLVLADMCYNLGIYRLLGFKKMLAALRERDYKKAADEMVNSDWYRQVKTRGVRLVAMMRTGEIQK